eukprot:gb/GECH01013352.1/.p1 GENE.gb/GECH01013352.1/~~gb/GECH01013352.1/.p1  ORF type:complete len:241 (+),score=14.41 gb/GECH01013352.1/:1-723(+)
MTVLAILRIATNVRYSFSQGDQHHSHITEIKSRLASLYLGYPYPYSTDERPNQWQHLSPERIAPLLLRIVREKEPRLYPHERKSAEESPVIHWIRNLNSESESKNENDKETVKTIVRNLYDDLIRRNNVKDFHFHLIKSMAPYRYRDKDDHKQRESREALQRVQEQYKRVKAASNALVAYKGFLTKYGQYMHDSISNAELPSEVTNWTPHFKDEESISTPDFTAATPKLQKKRKRFLLNP